MFRLASHLKMPVQRLKKETTATEFYEWYLYLCEPEKQDIYLANIAKEIRWSFVKKPQKYKLDDFLMTPKKKKSFKEQLEAAKRYWKSLVGFKK